MPASFSSAANGSSTRMDNRGGLVAALLHAAAKERYYVRLTKQDLSDLRRPIPFMINEISAAQQRS